MDHQSYQGEKRSRLRKKYLFLGLITFLNGYLLLSLVFGEMGWMKFIKMREAHQQLTGEMVSLRSQNNALLYEIDALKSDPHFIEGLAREQLGLVRAGELVYEFYDP